MNSYLITRTFEYWAHITVPLLFNQCCIFMALYYFLKTNLIRFISRIVPSCEGFGLALIVSIGVFGYRRFRLIDCKQGMYLDPMGLVLDKLST